MHLDQLWLHPAKSMIGERVERAELSMLGIIGDRRWAVRDELRGGIRGAKKFGALMTLAASTDDAGATMIEFPDGRRLAATDPMIDAALSTHLGHRVTLTELPDAGDLDHFRRGAPDSDDLMVELRSIFGRLEDEPLPDLSVFPPEIIEFESPPGTHHDAFPLLIMSTSALRSLALALPDSTIDVRRFRPSMVIDTGEGTGHPEFQWVGSRLVIGEATLEILAPCPRCVMVTRRVSDAIDEDRSVLRHIVRELDQNLGVYATVITPGAIEEGDKVTLLD
jgi:hypothetical protein